jgi:hypothetical protein
MAKYTEVLERIAYAMERIADAQELAIEMFAADEDLDEDLGEELDA